MSDQAHEKQSKRLPLNYEASDLRACLECKARPLRDVIDERRALVNKQKAQLEEGTEALIRNPHHRLAVHPHVARAQLKESRELMFHLLQYEQLLAKHEQLLSQLNQGATNDE